MSSLIFYCDENEALVAVDSALSSPDGEVTGFVEKAGYLPDRRMIVAGTGVSALFQGWKKMIATVLPQGGVEILSKLAQPFLAALDEELKSAGLWIEDRTATIYHFGIGPAGKVMAWAFRSENGYAPETLSYGLGVKPQISEYPDNLGRPFEELVVDLMDRQRQEQPMLPAEKRVVIGGQVTLSRLTADGCESCVCHEFPEFRR